jgi:hypothetical protein
VRTISNPNTTTIAKIAIELFTGAKPSRYDEAEERSECVPRQMPIDHHLLGIHHVNERVDRAYWLYWDLAFILWGIAMLAAGWSLLLQGRRETGTRAKTAS